MLGEGAENPLRKTRVGRAGERRAWGGQRGRRRERVEVDMLDVQVEAEGDLHGVMPREFARHIGCFPFSHCY